MKKIRSLINRLNCYRNAYYNQNVSLIPDELYDSLFDQLKNLEDTLGIIYPDSPTQTVGYDVISDLKKVKHNHLLLSLDKTTDFNEFYRRFNNQPFVIMDKLDGLTISLCYQNGQLLRGETRGNGEVGEDITHNVKTFSNVPLRIPFKGELIVDGEAIIDKDTFDEINSHMKDNPYKNQRNLVSGTVRQLDSKICASRNVKFYAWNLYKAAPTAEETNGERTVYGKSHNDNLRFLSELGFTTCNYGLCYAFDSAELFAQRIREIDEKAGIPIDGLVGRFDDIQYGESLGMTGHHPKHSIAFKFYQERNETTFRRIEWTTSRTNTINPVAVFDPIEIDGTTVSRATLSNVSQIKKLALGYDDSILVIKANQIIPQITENLTRSGTVEIPACCPNCGARTEIRMDGISEFLYCTNRKCSGAMLDRLVNFCGREGMNIRGLSEERIKTLYKCGYISDFASIYDLGLYKSKIENMEGFGKSSVDKLLKAIEESKSSKFVNVLVAIGIPSVGKSSAKLIARKCSNSPTKFLAMVMGNFDWSKLQDFGESTSKKINSYVQDNYDEIKAVFDNLVFDESNDETQDIFGGATFCITGKLVSYRNRNELVEDIERHGGKIVSGVTSKTNYLICNDKEEQTSKIKNAKKFGTKIISEEEYKEMVAQK